MPGRVSKQHINKSLCEEGPQISEDHLRGALTPRKINATAGSRFDQTKIYVAGHVVEVGDAVAALEAALFLSSSEFLWASCVVGFMKFLMSS